MARESRSLRSDLERCRVGCLRPEPRELAEERRVKAGDAGGGTPERMSKGLEGRQGEGDRVGSEGGLEDGGGGGGTWGWAICGCTVCLGLG